MSEIVSEELNGKKYNLNWSSFKIEEKKSEIMTDINIPNYKDGIDFVFEHNPDLLHVINENTTRLYRIENRNIPYDESREWIVSKREIIGCFFTDTINTLSNYIRKNQRQAWIELVYLDIPTSKLEDYHVMRNEYTQDMNVENDNRIIPNSVKRNHVDLSSLSQVTGNFLSFKNWQQELNQIISTLPKPKEITKQQAKEFYAEYLTNIFPESKVKDIVYHGTRGDWYKNQDFDLNLAGTSSNNKNNTEGVYFIKYKGAATAFGDKKTIIWALIDIKNPNILPLEEFNQTWRSKDDFLALKKGDWIIAEQEKSPEQYYQEALKRYEEEQNDKEETFRKFARKPTSPEDFHEEQLSTTYVVYKQEQIHILWSEKDIEQFKNRYNTKK